MRASCVMVQYICRLHITLIVVFVVHNVHVMRVLT